MKPRTEEEIRGCTVGELKTLSAPIQLVEYDPNWPLLFSGQAARIRSALGERVFLLEHTGSTSVPGLAAKPILDIVLSVADPADESAYIPDLESLGYTLRVREPEWYQHRMLKYSDPSVNLHVLPHGCEEIGRMLRFRDHLRSHPADRDLYERTKRELAGQEWKYTQNYADAKTAVIDEILARATENT